MKNIFRGLSKIRKRAFAVALASTIVTGSLGVGSLFVNADDAGRRIIDFEPLPDSVAWQYLPEGSDESDIEFPDSLAVTLFTRQEYHVEREKKEKEREERGQTVRRAAAVVCWACRPLVALGRGGGLRGGYGGCRPR